MNFAAACCKLCRRLLQNYFKGLEIDFSGTKIYFQAFEIYFRATEKVLFHGALDMFAPDLFFSYSALAKWEADAHGEVVAAAHRYALLGELAEAVVRA